MHGILLISGIFSLFVAAVYMLQIKHFKRMLAYSSLEHMGIVAIGLAAGGIAYYAVILHLIMHSFAKAGLFYQMGPLFRTFHSPQLRHLGSYFKFQPLGSIVLLLSFLSISAFPPSGLFITEFLILKSLLSQSYYSVLIITLLLITIIIYGMGRNIFNVLFTPAEEPLDDRPAEKISTLEYISPLILIGITIYLGLHIPDTLSDLIYQVTSVIKND
jgi:hydrogenase-4 component F